MKETFEAIYEKYAGIVYSRCLWYTKDPDAAKDIVHDIFLKVHKHMQLFQNQDNHHALLYRMVTNECINYLRKHRRSHTYKVSEINEISDESDQQRKLENNLDINRILKLFDKKSREIAWLYFIEGHTQEQIAGLMQISRKTVNRKLIKVKQKLGIVAQKDESPLKKPGD